MMTIRSGLDLYFKCPYHATVIKTLDRINKPIGISFWKIEFCISKSHRNSFLRQKIFHVADRIFSEMKDAGGEDSIGFSVEQHLGHVLEFSCAAAGNHGDTHRFADAPRDDEI